MAHQPIHLPSLVSLVCLSLADQQAHQSSLFVFLHCASLTHSACATNCSVTAVVSVSRSDVPLIMCSMSRQLSVVSPWSVVGKQLLLPSCLILAEAGTQIHHIRSLYSLCPSSAEQQPPILSEIVRTVSVPLT